MAEDREYERALAAAEGEVHVDIVPTPDGDLGATVTWGEWISDGVPRPGDSEGPMPVPRALVRAEEVARLYDIGDVVVSIPRDDLWRREWGVLSPLRPTFSPQDDQAEPDVADDGDEGVAPTTGWVEDEPGPDSDGRLH